MKLRNVSCLALLAMLVCFGSSTVLAQDYYTQNPAAPFHSTTLQENAPVQVAASAFPKNLKWQMEQIPSIATYKVAFAGVPGKKASHEGMDFVHNDPKVPRVPVIAAAKGTVAYVRTGCPQSSMFKHNTSLREAGSGWGNHVVLYHGNGIYTRYAHLAPGSTKAKVGDKMAPGDIIGEMGNSGRSETRHLHFEVGYKSAYFVASKPSQSFDLVLAPEKFLPGKAPAKPATRGVFTSDRNNVRSGPGTSNQVYHTPAAGTPFTIIAREQEWLKVRYVTKGNFADTLAKEATIEGWTHMSNVKLS